MADRRIKKEIGLKRMVEWKKLGDVCSLKARIGWQGLTQKEHKKTGDYLLVTGTDFKSNYQVDFDHCVYVDEIRYTQDPNIQLRPNDVLITKDGTLGKMAVIEDLPKPATLNGGLFVIRDTTGRIHHKFLLHYMLSSKFQSIIESNHTNGTIKHLTQALLTNFPFPIPSLQEQERIVGILDTFTASIENLKEQITQRRKQYEHYRDQLLDLEGKEGVEMKTLGDIMQIVRGASPRPIQNYLTTEDDGVNWIKIGDVSPNDKYITKTNEKITKEGAKKSRFLHPGDFILSNSMSFGRPYILKIEGCIHDGWIAMSDYENYVCSGYLYEILNADVTQRYWRKKANNGGAMSNLNSDIVKDTPIPVPSLSEQQRIVDILDKFEASIQNLESQLSQREKQYEYYRNKLLTFE